METIAALSDADREGLCSLEGTPRTLRSYEDIASEGERPDSMCMVLEGFVCRYKIVESGKRQIMSFHIPGDVPDSQSLFLKTMDHSLCTLVETTVLHFRHANVFAAFERYPGLTQLFWRDTLIDAAIFREWIVGLGRRDAYGRLARMLCEVVTKMRVMGLTEGRTCELPLTQAELADATGLSNVHVNRTLQQLRSADLITFQGGSLEVLDWEGLKAAGEFDAAYLHLRHADV